MGHCFVFWRTYQNILIFTSCFDLWYNKNVQKLNKIWAFIVMPDNLKQNFLPPAPSAPIDHNPPKAQGGGLAVPHAPAVGVATAPFPMDSGASLKIPTLLPPVPSPHAKQEGEKEIYKKVVLVILDGLGIASAAYGSAISNANTPTLNYLVSNFPSLSLQASGPLVGLPWGEMGNSEVGHLNIGAGRIVGQDLPRITVAIQSGDFFKNPTLLEAIMHASRNNSQLHLLGLVSEGAVHSLDEHLYACLALAESKGLKKVYIHMFTDGRDTAEKVALEDIKKLRARISRIGIGEIATVTGRFYAMDRGGHWNQTKMTYEALVEGKGEISHSAEDCIWRNYQNGIYDEMIKPTVICEIGLNASAYPIAQISDNDAVIFFNFRPDRSLQLTKAFILPQDLPEDFRHPPLKNLYFATMTEYAQNLPAHTAFPQINLKNNLPEVLSQKGLSQFHISESEKYAHVTSFFDCGRTEAYPLEERRIVASPDNARNYVDHPEMSAEELTDILISKISSSNFSFFLANFANADMVGHTGSLKSGIKAVEVLDQQLKKILETCLQAGACLMVSADHGNIEQMINIKTGNIDKDHTSNPVPLLIAGQGFRAASAKEKSFLSLSARVPDGSLCDIAPTILELLGIEKPKEMTGISLVEALRSNNI